MNFGKMKVGVKTLDDATLDLGYLKKIDRNLYDKKIILQALVMKDVDALRAISNSFYISNGIYQKVCNYIANLYRYDWYIVPEIYDDSIKEDNLYKLRTILNDKTNQVGDVLRHSCAILSEMTSLTSIMLGPDELGETLTKIQLIPLNSSSAVCVFITSNGHVEHKTFNIPSGVNPGDVEKCVEILNDRLKGTPFYSIAEKMIALKPVLSLHIEKYEALINAFVAMFNQMSETNKTASWGTSNLFDQPEYATNIDKLKKAVKLIESNNVWKFISNSENKQKINVQIGVNSSGNGYIDFYNGSNSVIQGHQAAEFIAQVYDSQNVLQDMSGVNVEWAWYYNSDLLDTEKYKGSTEKISTSDFPIDIKDPNSGKVITSPILELDYKNNGKGFDINSI